MKNDSTTKFPNENYSKAPKKYDPTNKIIYNHIDQKWSNDLADFLDYKISNKKKVTEMFSKYLTILQNFCGLYHLKMKTLRQKHKNFQTFWQHQNDLLLE